ncbi:hypothetical protein [Aquamicrobium defluvii]|uniref:hypothetical protein n=1 Tax=Aquamicrobium defluvii TaxID=69279 RepID=UPI001FD8F71E|nr:hypothetical protein [Aquamicrobium defluvii]
MSDRALLAQISPQQYSVRILWLVRREGFWDHWQAEPERFQQRCEAVLRSELRKTNVSWGSRVLPRDAVEARIQKLFRGYFTRVETRREFRNRVKVSACRVGWYRLAAPGERKEMNGGIVAGGAGGIEGPLRHFQQIHDQPSFPIGGAIGCHFVEPGLDRAGLRQSVI